MKNELFILIPAFNEEKTISKLILAISSLVTQNILVVNNGSTDRTAELAMKAGAMVITENRLGYGSACLAGIKYLNSLKLIPKYLVFFDADGQSHVKDIIKVASPALIKGIDYCQGSRMIKKDARVNLFSSARLANFIFSTILQLIWRQRITDLGPLRCIALNILNQLNMQSIGYGWTTEMSTKILKSRIYHLEIPVNYSQRLGGTSKISGNFRTAIRAAFIMSLTLIKVLFFWRAPKFEFT
ncbi:MAG: glycosyltransferase family 2 protein [Candidatus Hodarchaeales archaeon]